MAHGGKKAVVTKEVMVSIKNLKLVAVPPTMSAKLQEKTAKKFLTDRRLKKFSELAWDQGSATYAEVQEFIVNWKNTSRTSSVAGVELSWDLPKVRELFQLEDGSIKMKKRVKDKGESRFFPDPTVTREGGDNGYQLSKCKDPKLQTVFDFLHICFTCRTRRREVTYGFAAFMQEAELGKLDVLEAFYWSFLAEMARLKKHKGDGDVYTSIGMHLKFLLEYFKENPAGDEQTSKEDESEDEAGNSEDKDEDLEEEDWLVEPPSEKKEELADIEPVRRTLRGTKRDAGKPDKSLPGLKGSGTSTPVVKTPAVTPKVPLPASKAKPPPLVILDDDIKQESVEVEEGDDAAGEEGQEETSVLPREKVKEKLPEFLDDLEDMVKSVLCHYHQDELAEIRHESEKMEWEAEKLRLETEYDELMKRLEAKTQECEELKAKLEAAKTPPMTPGRISKPDSIFSPPAKRTHSKMSLGQVGSPETSRSSRVKANVPKVTPKE